MNDKFIKTEEEIGIMREAGKILATVMHAVEQSATIGISGLEIDSLAEKMIIESGSTPAFKGYGAEDGDPFPSTVCFSVNDGIVHGIPTGEKLKDGDVLKIDVGLKYQGLHADMARTFLIGNTSDEAEKLLETTKKSFNKGLAKIKDGASLHDYAQAVQECAEQAGYGVVKNLVGHGIGKELHEPPQIPNYVANHMQNFIFHEGMTVALEPMINIGTDETKLSDDGWTFVTADGSLSAHWENTILVTRKGVEILTKV